MSQDLLPQQAGQPLLNPPVNVPSSNPSLGPDTVGPLTPTGGVQTPYGDVTSTPPISVPYTAPTAVRRSASTANLRLRCLTTKTRDCAALPWADLPARRRNLYEYTPESILRW